ncbi:DUF6149 family protein [Haloplanus halobius]|uniref:DUF6149 family protein n=1 Tax=Haloplanus halobius TaxID=2934938 RepID=UPI00200EA8C4
MLLDQDRHHWLAKRALTSERFAAIAQRRLVSVHVDVFTDRSAPGHADERRAYFASLFDGLIDGYRVALDEGNPEAGARECVHVMANLDFWIHGWTELMEFPAAGLDPHLERHRAFFERHGVTREDPLGAFRPDDLPDAPATPERRSDPTFPNATAGYADDVYVEDAAGEIHVGADQPNPDDVDLSQLPAYMAEMEAKYDVSPSIAELDLPAFSE